MNRDAAPRRGIVRWRRGTRGTPPRGRGAPPLRPSAVGRPARRGDVLLAGRGSSFQLSRLQDRHASVPFGPTRVEFVLPHELGLAENRLPVLLDAALEINVDANKVPSARERRRTPLPGSGSLRAGCGQENQVMLPEL